MTLKLIIGAGMLLAVAGCAVEPYGPGVQSGQSYYNPDAQYDSYGNPGSTNPNYVNPADASPGYVNPQYANPGYASPGYYGGYYAPYSR
jgi:hypothetical protein